MHVASIQLKPLSTISLSPDETRIMKWIRSAHWEAQTGAREPIPYKTKVPEFYGGVRLYNMQGTQGGNALGTLELFIKKLQMSGVISKQELYPLTGHGNARALSLKKMDLDNLGVGKAEEDEE